MRTRFALLLLWTAAALAACDNDPAGPAVPRVAALEILQSGAPASELTLQVGERAQLRAAPEDAAGALIPDATVQWTSSAPAVARVDSTGLVEALAEGTATIRAAAGGVEDAVQLLVLPQSELAGVACGDTVDPLRLEPGQVLTTNARDSQLLCLGGGEGAQYMLIPFNGSSVAGAISMELNGAGLSGLQMSRSPAARGGLADAAPHLDSEFHAELRRRERQQLLGRLRAGADAGAAGPVGSPSFSRLAAEVPAVDDLLRLNVNARQSCTSPDYRIGRVEAVTRSAVIVADTANPEGGFTRADYRALGDTFDQVIRPINVGAFGEPSDIDENQRVVVFFTRAVNELTPRNASSLTQGFFFARDLFPTTDTPRLSGCEGSNQAEMFYLLVPDPRGEINGNARSRDFVRQTTVGVLAHEFQHLISASRRLHVLQTSNFLEEVWLNEGLSHIAEELVFYGTTPVGPRRNLDPEALRAAGAVEEFLEFQLQNFGRLRTFLENPEAETLMGQDELPTRGAAWAFLRYAADREPGADEAFWHALVNSTRTGLANLGATLGVPPMQWMQDWTVSVFTDDLDLPLEAAFQQPSWNFRTVMPEYTRATSYPLRLRALSASPTAQASARLKQGGTAYFLLRLGGETAALRTTSGGVPAPATLRLSLVRIR